MRNLLNLLLIILLLGIISCGEEKLPKTRILNLTEETLNISLKQGICPTVNFNNVFPDVITRYKDVQSVWTRITGLPNKKDVLFKPEPDQVYTIIVRPLYTEIK